MFKKELKPKLILFGLLTTLLFMVTSCGEKSSQTSDTLTIGTNIYPPYEMLDANGNFEGLDIDLANEIAKKLSKKLVIKEMAFDALIIALKQGKIDLIIAGMAITPSRKQEITMIPYIGNANGSFHLMFWKQIPDGIVTIDDLKKIPTATVCVQAANICEDMLGEYPFITVKPLPNISDLVMDLKYGKSVAAGIETLVAKKLAAEHPEIKLLEVHPAGQHQEMGQGVGINKNNPDLTTQITTIINQLKSNGFLQHLSYKWLKLEEGGNGVV